MTKFIISPFGNRNFENVTIHLPKHKWCEYMNTNYREYWMHSSETTKSNLPYSDDPNEDLCKAFQADHDVC